MRKYPIKVLMMVMLLITPLLANCADYQRVSIIALIGQPDKYEGKQVMVSGYLKIEHEGDAIYLTKEHADKVLAENAIWLDLTHEQTETWKTLSCKYATVYGKFTSKERGHFGLYSGSLVKIFNILENPDFERLRLDRKRIQKEFKEKEEK